MSVTLLRSALTQEDVHRLVKGESDQDRAVAAHKICRRINRSGLGDAERDAAHKVLAFMARDAAVMVRRALSVTLKNSPHLPNDIACKLAADIESIAVPILEESPAFTDDDLIEIINAGSAARQTAIAGRETLTTGVVETLVEVGAEDAVARAAANDGAEFSERSYTCAIDRFPENADITETFVDRPALPPAIAEKLVAIISDEALQRLVRKHALPPQMAVELAEGARERATIDILDQAGCTVDMQRFVQQLMLNGRLTPSIVMRGLCLGHMTFFEHAMAEMAGVAQRKAWLLVHDGGPLGLKAIFERAGMPARLYGAVRAAVDIYHELELGGGPEDRDRFSEVMLERVLTRQQGMSRDEVDYLLEKLDALMADNHESDADRIAATA